MKVLPPIQKYGRADINRRRGQVNDMGDRNGAKTIRRCLI
jgi:elongation factor G